MPALTIDYQHMKFLNTQIKGFMIRSLFGATALLMSILFAGSVSANITVADYMTLRAEAKTGDKSADARWRYYIIGLMDGIQAVQAPAEAEGVKLHFCIPVTLPISPKFLDAFIQEAIGRLSAKGLLAERISQPMALLVALELKTAFPCSE